jgi:hypothetical protein
LELEHLDEDPAIKHESLSGVSSALNLEDDQETGNIRGMAKGEGDDIYITQLAIDDVNEDFFPNEEDRDEDHLSLQKLGHVYASSGIRRWMREVINHEEEADFD